jgi:hypothetical protein
MCPSPDRRALDMPFLPKDGNDILSRLRILMRSLRYL